jgi:hypothetical protein
LQAYEIFAKALIEKRYEQEPGEKIVVALLLLLHPSRRNQRVINYL